ncbi:hypothetical protein J7F02_09930 [Streptomyces sp. ISL-112]|uniref:hypothetical protein n=1 Tax=unclassified Streptomyces TaxID=2593676 RepID=UPI001BE93019|nr:MULTISPECIES: hypothetical protein [unclassified Streptomyces]MBT2425987.1 hypothetical protein [Streptomyces sp. ISL-112]MBT2465369.1 hypothetical protein [Streptomyces sp. ISL-63]
MGPLVQEGAVEAFDLGRLPQQVELVLRRLERKPLGRPVTDAPAADTLLLHCAHGWEHPDGATFTSLPRLEQATSYSATDLRDALHGLATAGEVQLHHGVSVRAADLPVRVGFVPVVDWPRVNMHRHQGVERHLVQFWPASM